jgi:hypothetical protein
VEAGFFVVGASSCIFLDKENKKVLASHPLMFLEEYKRCDEHGDEGKGASVRYALKKHHFLHHDEILEFTFNFTTEEVAQQVVAALDKAILINTKIKEEYKHKDDDSILYLDPSLKAGFSRFGSTVYFFVFFFF